MFCEYCNYSAFAASAKAWAELTVTGISCDWEQNIAIKEVDMLYCSHKLYIAAYK
mgnify:CR=1 FL=1